MQQNYILMKQQMCLDVTIETFMQTISSVTSDIKGFAKLSKKSDTSKFIIFQITRYY